MKKMVRHAVRDWPRSWELKPNIPSLSLLVLIWAILFFFWGAGLLCSQWSAQGGAEGQAQQSGPRVQRRPRHLRHRPLAQVCRLLCRSVIGQTVTVSPCHCVTVTLVLTPVALRPRLFPLSPLVAPCLLPLSCACRKNYGCEVVCSLCSPLVALPPYFPCAPPHWRVCRENYGCEVVCFCADVGQGVGRRTVLEAKAKASGPRSFSLGT